LNAPKANSAWSLATNPLKLKTYKYRSTHCLISDSHRCCGSFVFHHVKSRGAGGSDDPTNLMPLCVKAHNEIHQKGLMYMSKKYASVETWLIENGWEIDGFSTKWIKVRSEEDND
jgi:hypothetical protein